MSSVILFSYLLGSYLLHVKSYTKNHCGIDVTFTNYKFPVIFYVASMSACLLLVITCFDMKVTYTVENPDFFREVSFSIIKEFHGTRWPNG